MRQQQAIWSNKTINHFNLLALHKSSLHGLSHYCRLRCSTLIRSWLSWPMRLLASTQKCLIMSTLASIRSSQASISIWMIRVAQNSTCWMIEPLQRGATSTIFTLKITDRAFKTLVSYNSRQAWARKMAARYLTSVRTKIWWELTILRQNMQVLKRMTLGSS